MRAFLAVKLSESVINDIKNLQEELRKYTIKGRWTNKDNLHITLKFFGEIKVEEVNKIREIINDISANFESFYIKLNKIGCFEGKDSIRVLWVDVKNDNNLMLLHDAIEIELSKAGFKKDDRKFKTHITIARDIILEKSIEEINNLYKLDSDYFAISKIYLMESKLENNRRVYKSIFEVPLKSNK
ncbi:RNA 2',3'-cyclic phosphodiesterase [Thermoanaerobacterium thermosaccharolyticum]|uniref:RNA 2',3'-cyclic phosphodiesterase n=1 Tax=Thermoanaerobacterium thermosaccharolyticum TaxID=1517 RepID=UPI00177F7514|nr:RNA 2',3'-cyclic phosphodiesterase [Thermoanaerobacterium thermosaccharolyticum]MBE0068331.1 RNA 2',3'-cyclic phosphodiesterase [Thermoanaerobacterium thermosaccharolyticum]MBE0228195.1 RNA 2',3'-cyclic phosphodiesterase [Thermoanaerobacterium thermosaccharolyticum]